MLFTLLTPSLWPRPYAGWWNALRYRPLLWGAVAALLGVAGGGYWAALSRAVQRDDPWLLFPLLPALLCGALAWLCRQRELLWRLAWVGALAGLFACHAARRVLPPAGDVSFLTFEAQPPAGPYQPHTVELEGTVADYPRRGDFYTQFPLECHPPYKGRLWTRVPYGTEVEIGDALRARVQIRQLERPGNPSERANYWSANGSGCWALGRVEKKVDIQWIHPPAGFSWERRIAGWRRGILHHYEQAFASVPGRPFPGLSAQLMTAVVFGEGGLPAPLPRAARDDFRAAGMSHILVASGTQISILVGAILFLARGAGFRRWPLLLLIIPAVLGYAVLVGGAASIWRAAGVGVLVTVALLLGRQVDGLSLWSAALLALLALDPLQAWSLSFQLTFGATWGLLVLTPALSRLIARYFAESRWNDAFALTLGAQAGTLPFTLYHFGTLSIVGLGANLLAVPLAAILLAAGTLSLIIHPLNGVSYNGINWLCTLAHISAAQSGGMWESRPLSLPGVLFLGTLASAIVTPSPEDWSLLRDIAREKLRSHRNAWTAKIPRTPASLGGFTALVLLVAVALGFALRPGDGNLHVTMLDVGQGESILIQSPGGRAVLVDGGTLEAGSRSDIGQAVIIPELQRRGIRRLDLLVLTHADADHCSGLTAVAREVPIDNFLDGPAATQARPDPAELDYVNLRREVEARGIRRTIPAAGQLFDLDGVHLTVLEPGGAPLKGDNNNAIVAMVEWGQSRILLTADIEKAAEERLLRNYPDLHCSVLKVGHHGSSTSTSPELLAATRPGAAIISCGKYNPFGHPNPGVLQRLEDDGIPVFRTDANGAIDVTCTREACGVTTFK